MALVSQAMRMRRDRDPRMVMIEKFEAELREWGVHLDSPLTGVDRLQPLKTLAGIRITGPDYLLMIYDRSGQYTSGNILVPDKYIEDKVQGKIALVMGVGPLCHGPEYEAWFGGEPPQVGEFVLTSIKDGVPFLFGKTVFKSVEWKYLRLCTFFPDLVM